MNHKWEEFTELSLDELLNWGWLRIVHPDDIPVALEKWTSAVKTGGKYDIEYRFQRGDGMYRWFLGRGIPLFNEEGEIVKWFGTSTDIDDQKRAERERQEAIEALKKSELHFRQLFESNIIGIVFTNSDGRIVDVNDAFLSTVGYTRFEILSGKIDWSDILPDNNSMGDGVLRGTSSQEIKRHQVIKEELEYFTKGGNRIAVLVGHATMEKDTITFVMDITERKLAENRALEAARAKSFFIANISHGTKFSKTTLIYILEIRTPMSGIIGMTDMLLDTPLSDQQHEYTSTIKRSSNELLHLINDILDFAKYEAGKVELHDTEFNLLSVTDDVMNLLGESANLKNIDLFYWVEDIFRQKIVIGDPGRYRQILINLGNKFFEYLG